MPFFFGAAFFFAAFLVAFFIDRFSLDIKICDLARSQCDSYIKLFASKVKKKMHNRGRAGRSRSPGTPAPGIVSLIAAGAC